jgi:hypothetical protein
MPIFAPGRPIDSVRPTVLVENPLTIGRHRFTLTVVDDAGTESKPDELVLEVRGRSTVGPLPGVVPPIVFPTAPPLQPIRRKTPR